METLNVSFMILPSRSNSKGESPIYARIKYGYQQIDLSTKVFVDSKKWNKEKNLVKKQHENADILNLEISKFKEAINKEYHGLLIRKEDISLHHIKDVLRNRNANKDHLINLFDAYITMLKNNLDPDDPTLTWKHYRTTKTKMIGFLNEMYRCNDIATDKIDYHFIIKFKNFCLHQCRNGSETIKKEIKRFKAVINNGLRLGLIQHDPFKNYKSESYTPASRPYLTKDELERIRDLQLTNNRLILARDLFLFMCYTSMSYKDMITLKLSDITNTAHNKEYITKKRSKTKNRYNAPVQPEVKKIIDSFITTPESIYRGSIFPMRSLGSLNGPLKQIAKLAGIEKHLTTHIGRHTFATLSLEAGVPIETVSRMMGHGSVKETEVYARVTTNKIDKEFSVDTIFF